MSRPPRYPRGAGPAVDSGCPESGPIKFASAGPVIRLSSEISRILSAFKNSQCQPMIVILLQLHIIAIFCLVY